MVVSFHIIVIVVSILFLSRLQKGLDVCMVAGQRGHTMTRSRLLLSLQQVIALGVELGARPSIHVQACKVEGPRRRRTRCRGGRGRVGGGTRGRVIIEPIVVVVLMWLMLCMGLAWLLGDLQGLRELVREVVALAAQAKTLRGITPTRASSRVSSTTGLDH